jgi:VIT1/CCC1 family predicted Fe2+/Mn2+ transporter
MSLELVYQRNRHHRGQNSGWLRAAVLGANDGLVSNASLLIGLAAAGKFSLLRVAGLAGIAAGAMSMAVGEYISVRSQADIEESDRQMEIEHLAADPEGELLELTQIYIERGLPVELASQVAKPLLRKMRSPLTFVMSWAITRPMPPSLSRPPSPLRSVSLLELSFLYSGRSCLHPVERLLR